MIENKSELKGKKKGCFPIGCLVFFALFLAIPTFFVFQNPEKYNTDPVSKLSRELEITVEQSEKVMETLIAIGMNEKLKVEHDELLDNAHFEGEKGYRLSDSDASNVILYMNADGSVYNVRYADTDLFTDGKIIANLKDLILTTQEMTNLQLSAEEAIKSLLKSPTTAEFPNITKWNFKKEDGVVTLQSYVDAQNAFGAMLRSEFQLKVKDGNVISLIMDGKEYIQQ